ncbi:MAG: tRNA 2-thiocytidine biosynthesis TtcA family protein [Clostridiales bacterium]|nr:tRNA 2-thiocytidine biosynthesis TtcA family protein [Clostridiales bacterium]
MQSILSGLRRAVVDYGMIDGGDRVVVGLSGGKDSLLLVKALQNYRLFSPQKFELAAVTVDLGLGADFSGLAEFCRSLDVPFYIEKTRIAQIVFDERKEKNPCSLCAKMRRGALNARVNSLGANKLALGHHADDLAETLLLSMFYEGRLSTFAPKSFMDRSGVTLIRPLIYIFEKDITALAKDLPVLYNPCPANHATQREYMKNLLKSVCKDIPFAKDRLHSAITHPDRYNLW